MTPRLLFLCQNLPYPPDGGALIRSYHTLRLLSREFEVTALCFHRQATRTTAEAVRNGVQGLSDFGRVEAFPIPQDTSRVRLLADHLRSVMGGRAYTRWTYESSTFRSRLAELLERERFDLVHLDSLDLVGYLEALPDVPTVVAHHNVESQLLERRAESGSGWRGRYIRHQARLTRREEARWCPRVDLNLVVSPEDGRALQTIAPEGRYLVVPNGVDTLAFTPAWDEPREGIVFVGGYTWFPNRDGMKYFAHEILPLVRRQRPDVPVTWVGRAKPEVQGRFREMGIEMTGYVEDIRPYVHRAACFIVPLRVGGGTRLKILDAWALGKAVVSTSPGCEGLEVRRGENMLVADGAEAFATEVLRVLASDELQLDLGRGGRETAERRYDWDVIGGEMLSEYRDLIEATARAGSS